MPTLEELKTQLLSISKGNIISSIEEETDKPWLTSPSYDLNRILSGSLYKSVQVSTHTVIAGPECSGKSSFMALLLADAQKKGYLPLIIDAEGAWTNTFVTRWGVNPENTIKIKSLWIEDILVQLAKIIDSGITNLAIAVDSIGAIESKKIITDGTNKDDVKADQGRLQKDIKRMLKMIVGLTKFNDCVAFSAAHYYGNPTGYGEPEKLGGGNYLKLSADTIINLKKQPIYENPNEKTKDKKGKVLGNKINATTLKNRYSPPFQEAIVDINFQKGVDKLAGLIDVALDIGLIERAGAWYSCEVMGMKVQGSDNLLKEIKESDNQPLLDGIENYLKTVGYSNINNELEIGNFENIEETETIKIENHKKRGRPKKE